MSSERIVGYILLGLGILVMIYAAIQIIMVFTNKAEPLEFFTSKPIVQEATNSEELSDLIQENPFAALSSSGASLPTPQLIDPQMLNGVLNMSVYFLIMHFLLGLGFKIANLGVQLVRPIRVEVKNNQLATMLEKKPTIPETNLA
ncbi:MAG: hypothetical protein O3B87_01595 [bacterium]|nr:hypothetical protein [bacterium]